MAQSEIITRQAVGSGGTMLLDGCGTPRRVSLAREAVVSADLVTATFGSAATPAFKVTETEPVVFILPANVPLYAHSTPTGGEFVSGTATDIL